MAFFVEYPDGQQVVDGRELTRVLDDNSKDISDAVCSMPDPLFLASGTLYVQCHAYYPKLVRHFLFNARHTTPS